jgi:hypothetical protein
MYVSNGMLNGMRTSMNLPDALLEQAKAKAAAEGVSVTRLMIEGLRSRIAVPARSSKQPLSLPSRKLGRSTVDLRDGRAVREVLDADEGSAFRDRH